MCLGYDFLLISWEGLRIFGGYVFFLKCWVFIWMYGCFERM